MTAAAATFDSDAPANRASESTVKATSSMPPAVAVVEPAANGQVGNGNAASTRQSPMHRVVVVGLGMVGLRMVEALVALDAKQDGERFRITVFCEEPYAAYNRMLLTSFFEHRSVDALTMKDGEWFVENCVEVIKRRVVQVVRSSEVEAASRGGFVIDDSGDRSEYDTLILATGSAAYVPSIPNVTSKGVFVYRTIEDLNKIISYANSRPVRRAAVIGGGLLGLEAAAALKSLKLEVSVVERNAHALARQLDADGAAIMNRELRKVGINVLPHRDTECILLGGGTDGQECAGLRFKPRKHGKDLHDTKHDDLECEMVVVSVGISPRDELSHGCGLEVHEKGGTVVDDELRTSDRSIFVVGEAVSHRGIYYGLVQPGYEMCTVVASVMAQERHARIHGADAATPTAKRYDGSDMSTKLKLAGVHVASFGDYFADRHAATSPDGLPPLVAAVRDPFGNEYKKLLFSADGKRLLGGILVGEASTKDYIKLHALSRSGAGELKVSPSDLLGMGKAKSAGADDDDDLFEIAKITKAKTFRELLLSHGEGTGCEVCKPTVASILASLHNDLIVAKPHLPLQDTNDRFLANIQRGGSFSVVPRVAGGEITPDKLIVIGQVAKEFGLYTKITGGQRIDLPEIWSRLVAAGFESGHAYGKALRTVKSCVGSSWCRYGVRDSTRLAIEVENRYKGVRAPHKIKGGVSGCVRECAEAQSKDFGLIATEKGWNVYVGGNGGAKPKHAVLLAAEVSEEDVIKLTRTARWMEKLDGGLEHLRDVIIRDKLGIAKTLEEQMANLTNNYKCEWAEVVNSQELRAQFAQFANTSETQEDIELETRRGQIEPAAWPKGDEDPGPTREETMKVIEEAGDVWSWVDVGSV
ncbi:hypothetical protein HK405_008517, partial [Cladochytrium tenue]